MCAGNQRARREESYHALFFSEQRLTQPSYVEFEITERESRWRCVPYPWSPLLLSFHVQHVCSGFLEIGLSVVRERNDSSNISSLRGGVIYFSPSSDSVYVDGAGTKLDPPPPALPESRFDAGNRFGLLYADGVLSLYVRQASTGYMPVLHGRVTLPRMTADPYVVINAYGQTRAIRAVNP